MAQNRTGSAIGLSFGGTDARYPASLAVAPASVERTLVETGDLWDGRRSPRASRERLQDWLHRREADGRVSGKSGNPSPGRRPSDWKHPSPAPHAAPIAARPIGVFPVA